MSFIPRTAVPSPQNLLFHVVERMLESRYHHVVRPTDRMIIVSVDTVNKVMFLKRNGDQASHSAYPFRYADAIATPTVGQTVIVSWDPAGPYVSARLA